MSNLNQIVSHILTIEFDTTSIKNLSVSGGHYLPSMLQIDGLTVVEKNVRNIDKFGNYIADLDISYKGINRTVTKTMWSKSFSKQEVLNFVEESYNKGSYIPGTTNTWGYEFPNGMKVQWYRSLTGEVISSFPKL